jgi:hypothetical protein
VQKVQQDGQNPLLNPLDPRDFYLRGYAKDQAYKPPTPQSFGELRGRISQVMANVDVLRRTWEDF